MAISIPENACRVAPWMAAVSDYRTGVMPLDEWAAYEYEDDLPDDPDMTEWND